MSGVSPRRLSDVAADGFVMKICGITSVADAMHAVGCGATAIGFVFWPRSPRYVAPAAAARIIGRLPADVVPVGVFVDEPIVQLREIVARTGIGAVQLHGAEPPAYAVGLALPLLRSVGIQADDVELEAWPAQTMFLIDAVDPIRRGGTGATVDWARAAAIARRAPVVLAGGLTPENVAEAVATVRPLGVDVSSGVEVSPGVKDLDKVQRFLVNARHALIQTDVKAGVR
jgi:phosphoribosylanthranilate isomerase